MISLSQYPTMKKQLDNILLTIMAGAFTVTAPFIIVEILTEMNAESVCLFPTE